MTDDAGGDLGEVVMLVDGPGIEDVVVIEDVWSMLMRSCGGGELEVGRDFVGLLLATNGDESWGAERGGEDGGGVCRIGRASIMGGGGGNSSFFTLKYMSDIFQG